MKKQVSILSLLLAILWGGSVASAQGTATRAGNVSKTSTITAINHTTRVVTLRDAQGNVEDVLCGPEIKRFDELKVGDTVTFSYHAAVVYQIVKPGEKTATAAGPAVVRGQGVKPSGAVTQQMKTTAACYECHAANTAVDNTFVQYYPTLFEVAKRLGTVKPTYDPAHKL